MDLKDLIQSFRIDADDISQPHLFPTDNVILWLNEAQEEACIRKRLLFEKSDPTLCRIEVDENNGSVYELSDQIAEVVYAYVIDAYGYKYILGITTREALDLERPNWRDEVRRPRNIIHHETAIEFDCKLDASYTLYIEVYRLPCKKLKSDGDKPEIHRLHHSNLIYWALHKAYSVPDADTMNSDKAAKSLAKFEDYFGRRPDADMRKDQNSNRPHRNIGWR